MKSCVHQPKALLSNLIFTPPQPWGKYCELYALPGSTEGMKEGEAAVDKYGIAALHLPVAPPAIGLEPTCRVQSSPWAARLAAAGDVQE